MCPEEVQHRFGKKMERCPFCKSSHVGLYMGPHPHVTCLQCGADGPISKLRSRDDYYGRHHTALDGWNQAS
jgi:transposase-like protein